MKRDRSALFGGGQDIGLRSYYWRLRLGLTFSIVLKIVGNDAPNISHQT